MGFTNNMPTPLYNASMQLAVPTININHWDVVIVEYGGDSGSCALKDRLLYVQ